MAPRNDTSLDDGPLFRADDLLAIGLGCNQGNGRQQLNEALHQLEELLGPLRVAPLYRSAAISQIPQDDYLNTVALARLPTALSLRQTAISLGQLSPRQLLTHLKQLERRAGRDFASSRNAPRPLDLDILLWGQETMALPEQGASDGPSAEPTGAGPQWPGAIEIPHPRLRLRRFVLAPLCDLLPSLPLPPDGITAQQALTALGDEQRVERCEPLPR